MPVFVENTQDMKRVLNNLRIQLASTLENIYLVLFGIVALYLFLSKTSFEIPWKMFMRTEEGAMREWCRWLLEPPYQLLGYVAVLRCLFQKEYKWKNTVFAVAILWGGRYLWRQNSQFKIILLTLLIVGAVGISYQKMIKVHFLIISSALAITVLCAVTGIIENYIFIRGVSNVKRMSFGINAPTNFASFVFFQILSWWYMRREKLTYFEAGVTGGISVFLMVFCNTRTACILLAMIAVSMLWMRFRYIQAAKTGKRYQINKLIAILSGLCYPILTTFMFSLTAMYTTDSDFLVKMDRWLSSRLSLGHTALDVYGVSWFGQYVPMYAFSDGETAGNYFYIDSSFLQMPIVFGMAAMVFFLVAFMWISCRAVKEKDWIFLLILVFAGVHSAIEPHLLEVQYCIFLLALLAGTKRERGLEIKEIFGRIRWKEK